VAIHSLYVSVNNALRHQLLDGIPRVYVRNLEHPSVCTATSPALTF
jgi:hypothetical protein